MPHAGPTYEDFAPHVGSDFSIPREGAPDPVIFKLVEATPLKHKPPSGDFRDPFRLIFRVSDDEVFPQGSYRLSHRVMGDQDIFIVPVGKSEAGVDYCATFN